MKYLTLWLEAPLQSWGVDSRFDLRNTLDFPTKSGIFGLLLAASGDSGPQEELLARLGPCPLAVMTFRDPERPDEPSLRDFQMVGNGYDSSVDWQKLLVPKKIDGKAPSSNSGTGGVKLTYRHYLQDRKFAAVLELPDDLAGKFSAALASPVYSLFLGRKCCVPTDVVGRGTFTTETEAFEEILAIAAAKKVVPAKRIVEVPPGTAGAETFYDLPVRFGGHKVYRDRTVRIDPWPAEQP